MAARDAVPGISNPLKCQSFESRVDPSFWFALSSLKLNKWKLDASPKPALGHYRTPPKAVHSSGHDTVIEFNAHSFDGTAADGSAGAYGYISNYNTEEDWRNQRLQTAKELETNWETELRSKPEEVLRCPAKLVPFHLLCYANLKKYVFDHHFSFPVFSTKWNVMRNTEAGVDLDQAAKKYMENAPVEQRGLFIFGEQRADPTKIAIEPLSFLLEKESLKGLNESWNWGFGYLNPSWIEETQPLQNLLAFLTFHPSLLPTLSPLPILSVRNSPGGITSKLLYLEHGDQIPPKFRPQWETDFSGRRIPRRHNLSASMDPKQRIREARDLNNNLMKWRVAQGINLDIVKNSKVLVLGMGTLGCAVVRTLMGWGVDKFKIVDNGIVSFSNPARQNLYTFEDCVENASKVHAAAAAMRRIDPNVSVDPFTLTIPMPDHPSSFLDQEYQQLLDLISWSDVVFLLVDTREARWYPTLICMAMDKLVINAAVGFESFVVMRHGLPGQKEKRLGCYFCSDIVSPQNSTDNATLDQQCTVTRPGIATIASSYAAELYISLLQHPLGALAPIPPRADTQSDITTSSSLSDTKSSFGTCPHQIRGHLSNWEQSCLSGLASPFCAGCGDKIVQEWRNRGPEFVKSVCQRGGGKVVERVCGLEEAKREFEGGWDGEGEGDEEWEL